MGFLKNPSQVARVWNNQSTSVVWSHLPSLTDCRFPLGIVMGFLKNPSRFEMGPTIRSVTGFPPHPPHPKSIPVQESPARTSHTALPCTQPRRGWKSSAQSIPRDRCCLRGPRESRSLAAAVSGKWFWLRNLTRNVFMKASWSFFLGIYCPYPFDSFLM